MKRNLSWLYVLIGVLVLAAVTMFLMSRRETAGPGGGDSPWMTSAALVVLLFVAGLSARRRHNRKDRDRDDG